jgi:hypothetical protein
MRFAIFPCTNAGVSGLIEYVIGVTGAKQIEEVQSAL